MLTFQAQIYRISDVLGWDDRKELVLSPRFQRRPVWSPRGKSYLIDSIIRGVPLPQFFVREKVLVREKRTIREVVDGQQRIRSILDFLNDKLTIMTMHNKEYAGIKYNSLPEKVQTDVLGFPLSVNVLVGADDSDVLQVFARLNSYSVPLNNQEKLNALYVGAFKGKVDSLSRLHLAYWERNKILTSQAISRMKEVELTAELIAAMLNDLQHGKKILNDLYKKYDDEFPESEYLEERFVDILQLILQITSDSLAEMEFKRPPLFYSLFCALYDLKYTLASKATDPVNKFREESLQNVQQELFKLDEALKGAKIYKYTTFVSSSRSSTDKIHNRQVRHNVLVDILKDCFQTCPQ